MYIKQFQIENFKGFLRTGERSLSPGLNIVCGANNAGKTAVLEALSPTTATNPHRSPKTVPAPGAQPDPNSRITISLIVSGEELAQMIRELGAVQFRLPAPDPGDPLGVGLRYARNDVHSGRRLVQSVLQRRELTFELRREFQANWQVARRPSFGLYRIDPGMNPVGFVQFRMAADGSISDVNFGQDANPVDIGVQIIPAVVNRIYRFPAERMNIGVCAVGDNPNLSPNGSDLPRVLSILQANGSRFAKYNRLVREILPQVRHVSVHPVVNQQVEIRVWAFDPALEREDLALPLGQCGTGIGQVLSILYVVLFAPTPRMILIDEPQSFLHPGAARKLVEVLKNHPQHQFVIATHSPTVISAADPETITVVKAVDGESSLESVDPDDAKSLRLYLAEVGARLADVFGADRILWVEGRTEELCFPLILEGIAKEGLRGTSIVGVSNTGDLETRDAKRVFDMYDRLSDRNNLLPPAVGFIFDSECHRDQVKIEMVRRSRDLLRFLPRRMYENYLLKPEAIAAVVNGVPGFREAPVTADEVAALIELMKVDDRYFRPCRVDQAHWDRDINAAMVLEAIFRTLSETRVEFDKVIHCVSLTEWLIENAPDELRLLSEFIVECLNRQPGGVPPAD